MMIQANSQQSLKSSVFSRGTPIEVNDIPEPSPKKVYERKFKSGENATSEWDADEEYYSAEERRTTGKKKKKRGPSIQI